MMYAYYSKLWVRHILTKEQGRVTADGMSSIGRVDPFFLFFLQ